MKARLTWRVTSATSHGSECGRYSVSVANGNPMIVTAWERVSRPHEAMASWKTRSRDQGFESAKQFCQYHADAEAEANEKRGSHGPV